MNGIAGVAAALALSATCVGAQEISAAYSKCMGETGGVTDAMQDCISAELSRQDKRLNTAYGAMMKSPELAEKRRTQLRDAQRKWIAFRDANCGFYFDPDGGSSARLAANECVLKMTADRAAELEALGPQ